MNEKDNFSKYYELKRQFYSFNLALLESNEA